ncbi:MAG TPA: winged helix-turn-helix domain-containing protein [Thermoanaerobaculia bacterium]|nr:winged helix-turn-helix domain-containing protein [Thermoanaerobaculia bacterium]
MTGELFRFGPFRLDVASRQLERDGQVIALQPKVFELLCYLVEGRERTVSKEEMLERLWPETYVTENVVARAVRGVRRALGDDARAPRYVKTLPKQGYRFIAAVTESNDGPRPSAPARSLAVLPFVSIPPLSASDGLGLAMAESLINRLSVSRDLVVRPVRAVLPYGDSKAELEEIGRELRVEAVVDGAVQQSGDEFCVTARLVGTESGKAIWSGRFEEPWSGVMAIQQTLCERIADSLELELGAGTRNRDPSDHVDSPEAYRCLLRARYLISRRTPEAARRAVEELERALDHDPTQAPAWLALAEAHDSLGTLGVATAEHFERTRRCATRALALAPTSGLAHSLLGRVAWQYDFDWKAARQHLGRSVELAPGDVEVLIAHSDFSCYQRDHDEAQSLSRRAVAIDPTSPYAHALSAQALYVGGRSRHALEVAEEALELTPDFGFVRLFAGLASLQLGEHRQAIEHLEIAASSSRPDFAAALGYAYGVVGDQRFARQTLAAIERQPGAEPTPPIVDAVVHLGLGEIDRVVAALERCVEARSWHVLIAYADPMFEPLRSTGRLDPLFERLGLSHGERHR